MPEPSLDDLYRVAVARVKCEESHLFFSRYFFKARQGIKFIVNWHHHLVADVVDDVIAGRKKNVLIEVSPGSSKTELVVINLIARGLALNPRARFLHLSGSDTLASLNSSTAREIVLSDEYQELWPLKIADDAKAKKRWNVLVDGHPAGGVYATALGGQVTGFRAGHMAEGFQGCFVSGTRVMTDQGEKVIDEIAPGDVVLSFNHDTGASEYAVVEATREILRDEIVEVETKARRRIRCTPDHRFYDGKSYREISSFSSGDRLVALHGRPVDAMPDVSRGISSLPKRCNESDQTRTRGDLLFEDLWDRAREGVRAASQTARRYLSRLLCTFPAAEPSYADVFESMRGSLAFTKNARPGELKLSRAAQGSTDSVSEVKTSNTGTRWLRLFDLWVDKTTRRSPYGREHLEQPASKLSDALRSVPRHAPQVAADSVSSVTPLGERPTKVYDIQVAKNRNFFAEGVLVHNCILIDDPIKPEDAFSRVKIDAANRKLVTTVKSRRATPDTPIILIMQRLAERDPAGFVRAGNLQGYWDVVRIPAVLSEADVASLAPKYQALVPTDTPAVDGRISYWPYKEPLDQLLAMERGDGVDQSGARVSRHVFSSQYQQAPVALGGNIIKGEYFKRYTVLPKIRWRKVFADTAQKTKERNDYSVFGEYGMGVDGWVYLLDLIRGKWEAPELQKRAIAFWNKCKARDIETYGQIRKMMVEDKSSGTGLVQTLKLPPYNIPIEGIERDKDKLTRVMDALPYIEAGQVAVPEEAAFTNDFVAEAEAFTSDDTHDFDDQVDTLIDAIADMLQSGNKLKQWEALAGGAKETAASPELNPFLRKIHATQKGLVQKSYQRERPS